MGKDIKNMKPGELVETMIFTAIQYNDNLKSAKSSPYSTKEEMRSFYLEEYRKKSEPLKAELDRREKLYSQKA